MDKLRKPTDTGDACSHCAAPLNDAGVALSAAAALCPDMSTVDGDQIDEIVQKTTEAAHFLKAVSHEGRLLILCHLVSGEKSVTELEELLMARQAAVSQQLSRLRLEGLVTPRREGKAIYYRLSDDKPRRILELVYDLFCAQTVAAKHPETHDV